MEDKNDIDLHEVSDNEEITTRISGNATRNIRTSNKTTSYSIVCTPNISKDFSILIFFICGGLILSIISYQGSFIFWRYPLSDLGTINTVNGNTNIWARTIFDLTMVIAGLYMMRISLLFSANPKLSRSGLKAIMTFISAIGFFILITPYDFNDLIHEIGAALVFGMLWGLTDLFSFELYTSNFKSRSIISQLILQGTVLPYAYLFVIHLRVEDAIQKLAVAGLIYSLWLTTNINGHFAKKTIQNISSN